MASGLAYLTAKAVECAATVEWIASQLSSIPTLHSNHPHIDQELDERVLQARKRIAQLRRIIALNASALVPRGISIVNELQLDVYILSESYLPALRKEEASEAQFGGLATRTAGRCGLTDVRDILVNLSGGHAVLPAILTCPLLFAPPHQRHTLIDLVSIYHEFGHIVFEARSEIRNGLTQVCTDFFRKLEQGGGFLNPDQREERRKQINQAIAYWTRSRLAEIFSDIFATYTTGPAYFYSCADMAIPYGDNPYEIDITDEHPPMAARVSVCKKSLLPDQLESEVGKRTSELWDEHIHTKAGSSEFRLWCGDDLLEEMVAESVGSLSRVGVFQRYAAGQAAQVVPGQDVNLEELLNESTRMLLRQPASYTSWERPFVDALFQ